MKSKKLKGLKLHKESITNLDPQNVKGGHHCPISRHCSNNCSNGCSVTCSQYGGNTNCAI